MKFCQLRRRIIFPFRATLGSAGFDFFACDDIVLFPNEVTEIETGIALKEVPSTVYGKFESRSSLARANVQVVGGIIDGDYEGELRVMLRNYGTDVYVIEKGRAYAQLVFNTFMADNIAYVSCIPAEAVSQRSVANTVRGENGFGSSDKREGEEQNE